MITGSMPSTTVYGTWAENVEVWSVDDDTLFDLSAVTEITLTLRDQLTRFIYLTARLTDGEITIPAFGVIQWIIPADKMAALSAKIYNMLLLLEVGPIKVPIILGPLSVVE